MKLNYHAFPDHGGNFAFYAKDDVEAKSLVEDYLKETGRDFSASVYKWSDIKKGWNFEDEEFKVAIDEPEVMQEQEFRLEINYVKYVKVTGVATESEFYKKAQEAAEKLHNLGDKEGWYIIRKGVCGTSMTDDDRYHIKTKDIVVVKLDN
jgi:hypothetical protein